MVESDPTDRDETRGLGGVIDERQFLAVAGSDVARSARYGNRLSCLMIHVDRSAWGGAGRKLADDEALRHFVSVCKSTLRESDYIGRIGGRFAVMLPETSLLSAHGVAERILANLGASSGMAAATSIGVAEYSAGWSRDQFVKAAEMAMLDAAVNGGNQAVCYLDDLPLRSGDPLFN